MNIASVDINLLKVFHALYQKRSVTRAGESIGLAQSSMSNALSRLRFLLDDRLFIRTPEGMIPTGQATYLAPKIAAVLSLVDEIVNPAEAFDPATAEAEIIVEASDNIAWQLVPSWAADLQACAPNLDLRLRSLDKNTCFANLDDGSADALLGVFGDVPARFYQQPVFSEEFVCISRRNHPALKDGLTLQHFADIPQVLMTLRADARGAVDSILKKLGVQRRVAITVSGFVIIPDIVANTDYLALVPKRVAESLAERSGCDVFPVPFTIPRWQMLLIWSQSTHGIAAKKYALDQLIDVCTRFG